MENLKIKFKAEKKIHLLHPEREIKFFCDL